MNVIEKINQLGSYPQDTAVNQYIFAEKAGLRLMEGL